MEGHTGVAPRKGSDAIPYGTRRAEWPQKGCGLIYEIRNLVKNLYFKRLGNS
jgi:hypothetical protein